MSNPPLLSPVFSRTGGLLKFIPYPDYADPALLAWDLSTEFAAIVAAQNTADTAVTNAATALAAANEADDTADAAQATANAALALSSLPTGAYIHPMMMRVISASLLDPTVQASQHEHAYAGLNGSNAEGDVKFLLASGNYELSIAYVRLVSGGQLQIKLNGTSLSFGNIEMYNATTLLGQFLRITLPNVATSGLQTLNLKVPSHNASSTGYNCLFSYIAIGRKT